MCNMSDLSLPGVWTDTTVFISDVFDNLSWKCQDLFIMEEYDQYQRTLTTTAHSLRNTGTNFTRLHGSGGTASQFHNMSCRLQPANRNIAIVHSCIQNQPTTVNSTTLPVLLSSYREIHCQVIKQTKTLFFITLGKYHNTYCRISINSKKMKDLHQDQLLQTCIL